MAEHEDDYQAVRRDLLTTATRQLRVALAALRRARDVSGHHPDGRDLSIAVQWVENSLLRIEHGTPKDSVELDAEA